jgi:hypothetical protein
MFDSEILRDFLCMQGNNLVGSAVECDQNETKSNKSESLEKKMIKKKLKSYGLNDEFESSHENDSILSNDKSISKSENGVKNSNTSNNINNNNNTNENKEELRVMLPDKTICSIEIKPNIDTDQVYNVKIKFILFFIWKKNLTD